MIHLPDSILILFFASSLVSFVYQFMVDKEWQRLGFKVAIAVFEDIPGGRASSVRRACPFPPARFCSGPGCRLFVPGSSRAFLSDPIRNECAVASAAALGAQCRRVASSSGGRLRACASGHRVRTSCLEKRENLLQKPASTLDDLLPALLWLTAATGSRFGSISSP